MNEENELSVLIRRLKRIGIDIECWGNVPWIYLLYVNGNVVREKFHSEHYFTIAFTPVRLGDKLRLTDISEIFKVIRKYRYPTQFNSVICPNCGEEDNFHTNYDYSKPDKPISEAFCNKCGGNIPLNLLK